jgi:hypothetical protein
VVTHEAAASVEVSIRGAHFSSQLFGHRNAK